MCTQTAHNRSRMTTCVIFLCNAWYLILQSAALTTRGSDWRGNCDGDCDSMWETSPHMTVWRKRWLVTDYDYVQLFIRGFEWRQTSTAAGRTSVTKTALSVLFSSIILKAAISNSLCVSVPLTSDILQNSVNCNGLYVSRVAYCFCAVELLLVALVLTANRSITCRFSDSPIRRHPDSSTSRFVDVPIRRQPRVSPTTNRDKKK